MVKIFSFEKRNDADIAEVVLNALKWHSSVNEDKIKVKVEDAWVTLEGETEWEFQKTEARKAVESLFGVRGISNNLKVTPIVTAMDISRKINAAFHRSATVDAERIQLEVIGSKVILKGNVRSYAEKKDAENATWLAPGVDKVENNLTIELGAASY